MNTYEQRKIEVLAKGIAVLGDRAPESVVETFGDATEIQLAEIIRKEAGKPGSTGGGASVARAVLKQRSLSGPAWHEDAEINLIFEQRRQAAENADTPGHRGISGWASLEQISDQLRRLDPDGDWYYEGNRYDGLGWQVRKPEVDPDCAICGESVPQGERANMYDRERLGQPDYRSGVVHAECGIGEGWEVS